METPEASKKSDARYLAFWERQPGFVYFISAGNPAVAVKIGISTAETMRKRLKSHQSSNHEPLYILGLISFSNEEKPMAAANALERQLHEQFSSARRFVLGPGNEWFNPTADILEYINQHSSAPDIYGLARTIAQIGPRLKNET